MVARVCSVSWIWLNLWLALHPGSVDDEVMKMLNRFALVVRPGAPYIEWAAKVFGQSVAEVRKEIGEYEPTVYLLPESKAADLSDPGVLKGHWRAIFKEELEGWCTDEEAWPKQRSEALFRAWFKLEFCTVIHDLGRDPLTLEA